MRREYGAGVVEPRDEAIDLVRLADRVLAELPAIRK